MEVNSLRISGFLTFPTYIRRARYARPTIRKKISEIKKRRLKVGLEKKKLFQKVARAEKGQRKGCKRPLKEGLTGSRKRMRKIMKEISCRSIPSYGHPIGNLFSYEFGMTDRRKIPNLGATWSQKKILPAPNC